MQRAILSIELSSEVKPPNKLHQVFQMFVLESSYTSIKLHQDKL